MPCFTSGHCRERGDGWCKGLPGGTVTDMMNRRLKRRERRIWRLANDLNFMEMHYDMCADREPYKRLSDDTADSNKRVMQMMTWILSQVMTIEPVKSGSATGLLWVPPFATVAMMHVDVSQAATLWTAL
jgi:hypothetical protein